MSKIIGDIALYGSIQHGGAYIASLPDGRMFGDGELMKGRSLTDAVWLAVLDIREAGVAKGMVRVFAPGGRKMALMDIQKVVYFGELEWGPAPVYEISFEAIMAAAEKE